ncbi:MAG: TonB-dependent receptor [Kangiellaceae bacterium]|nr:TonB-dependent receptor [Kangiellaceae bacterium]
MTNFDRSFNGIWTGSAGQNSIMDAENYLANNMDFGAGYGTVGDFYTANPGTQRCFQYVSSGELVCQGDIAIEQLGDNGLVQILNALHEPVSRDQIMSNTRFSWQHENNSLSLGFVFADIDHRRNLQTSLFLSEVNSNDGKVLDIVAVDNQGQVSAYLSDSGVVKHGQWRGDDRITLTSYSLYFNDEFQYSKALRFDGGLRFENAKYHGISLTGLGDRISVEGALDIDGNDIDNVLANNTATRRFGDSGAIEHTATYDELAWTIGFNYLLNDNSAAYGRYANTFQTPRADRIGDIRNSATLDDTPISEMDFVELGARFTSDTLSTSATLFQTQLDNLATGGIGFDNSGTQILNIAALRVTGVELDLSWHPSKWITIDSQGVLQKSELSALTNPDLAHWQGNEPARTPSTQVRVNATIHVNSDFDIYTSYHYLSKRFGANDNIVAFDACGIVDLGSSYKLNKQMTIQLKGRNLTDDICYNEGNPRATSTENQLAYGFARPIAGTTWLASLTYEF